MPYVKSFDEEPTSEPACIHLRSKSMYVLGQLRTPDTPQEGPSHHCWCNLTQHVFGPDSQNVSRRGCIAGRECFKETY